MLFVFLLIDFDHYIMRFKGVTTNLNVRQMYCIIANPDHFDHLVLLLTLIISTTFQIMMACELCCSVSLFHNYLCVQVLNNQLGCFLQMASSYSQLRWIQMQKKRMHNGHVCFFSLHDNHD
jgi:hypothetical protein